MYKKEILALKEEARKTKKFNGLYKKVVQSISKKTGLRIRQIRTIGDILRSGELTDKEVSTLLDRGRYTYAFSTHLYQAGLTDLIPPEFYSNEQFLYENKIIYLPNGLYEGDEDIEKFAVPDNILYVGSAAFKGCKALKEIHFNNNLTHIGKSAFRDCISLDKIVLPNTVIYLGSKCFEGCTGLKEVMLPARLKSIPYRGFRNCTDLKEITGPRRIQVDARGFEGCSSIKDIDMTITGDIGYSAFSGCGSLEFLTIKSEAIGSFAFLDCKNLKDMVAEYSPKEIGENVFSGCDELKFITISDYRYRVDAIKRKQINKNSATVKSLETEGLPQIICERSLKKALLLQQE